MKFMTSGGGTVTAANIKAARLMAEQYGMGEVTGPVADLPTHSR